MNPRLGIASSQVQEVKDGQEEDVVKAVVNLAKGGRTLVTEGLETLNGVKAFRMSKGTNSSKVVVIGRNMEDVRLYKQ